MLYISLNLIKITSLIEIEFFADLEFKFVDNGDIKIIRMNLVVFKIPTESPGNFKFN